MTSQPDTEQPRHPPSRDQAIVLQLRIFKTLALLLALALVLGAAYYVYQRRLGNPVQILVNGKPIGIARNAESANRIVAEAEAKEIGPAFSSATPIRLETLAFRPASPQSLINEDSDLIANLQKSLTLRVPAWMIFVNGKPSVALPTEDDAESALSMVKQHFAAMPPAAPIVGEPSILQKIAIKLKATPVERTRNSPQAAAPYFWTPPPSKTYVVQPGDTGYRIAMRFHLPFSDFLAANSSINVNQLKPGDTVNVQDMPLLLNVSVQKSINQTQRVIPTGPASEAGLEQVEIVATYVDGQETSENVLRVSLLKKPMTAREL